MWKNHLALVSVKESWVFCVVAWGLLETFQDLGYGSLYKVYSSHVAPVLQHLPCTAKLWQRGKDARLSWHGNFSRPMPPLHQSIKLNGYRQWKVTAHWPGCSHTVASRKFAAKATKLTLCSKSNRSQHDLLVMPPRPPLLADIVAG